MSKVVLVVGGAGYIGSHCARLLSERGVEVVVLDDLSAGHREAVSGPLIVADIRDRAAMRDALQSRPFDAVVHFAARALVSESTANPALYFDVNVGGTATLIAAMIEAGVDTLLFSSSCSIYGAPQYVPVDEAHPKAPMSPYGLSKWMVEQMLDEVRLRHGLRISSLRYFNAAGAHPSGELGESHAVETHLIPLAFDAALGRRPPLQVYGRDYDTPDGTCIRDYVHVMDLAEAHLSALEAMWRGHPGSAWNLGTGRGSSVLQVLDAVARVSGLTVPREDAARREGDPPKVWASAAAIRRELGWTPKHTELEEIIASAWRWTRAPRY
ncbi:MAG: UDP-glucose 4-epimerase GalE [Alphaproteobacteria bacterium]|nr:UDP-glucose 4-epimerase GalE [Alphaproteobacteria bacterium]